MISYIQKSIMDVIGMNEKIISINDENYQSDEECKIWVSSDDDDDKEEEWVSEDDNDRYKPSISPRGPTADEYQFSVNDNEIINKNFRQSNSTISNLSKKPDAVYPIKTRATDNKAKDDQLLDQDSRSLENKDSSTAADKIGFSGIKKILSLCNWKYPIVIVIQNIKTFPSDNLNDLIYLVKKYRSKHRLKLCLMLGVQNNSYEDLMSKISIKTSNFMIMKKFYFPAMK